MHEDYGAEGVRVEYKSRTALVDNWAEFAFDNTAVSTSRLSIAKVWLDWEHRRLYDGELFCPAKQWKPYAPGQENIRNLWTGWAFARQDGFVVDQRALNVQ